MVELPKETEPPSDNPVPAVMVTDELANELLGTFDNPKAIVPDPVIGEPESTSIPSEPETATDVTEPAELVKGKSLTRPKLTSLLLSVYISLSLTAIGLPVKS